MIDTIAATQICMLAAVQALITTHPDRDALLVAFRQHASALLAAQAQRAIAIGQGQENRGIDVLRRVIADWEEEMSRR